MYKSQNRKLKSSQYDNDKYMSICDKPHRYFQNGVENISTSEEKSYRGPKNRGYYVFIHGEESSTEKANCNFQRAKKIPIVLTPSPPADLEWDEDMGNTAPVTREDATWTAMYR